MPQLLYVDPSTLATALQFPHILQLSQEFRDREGRDLMIGVRIIKESSLRNNNNPRRKLYQINRIVAIR